jgi:hypothetical protein
MEASRYKMAGAAVCAALLATLVLAAGASAVPTTSEIVIPAGYVATLSSATFGDDIINPGNCPADPLAYGYQLNAGPNVQLATGVGCEPAAGATIGPFSTPTQLRVYLNDVGCGITPYLFYSDGGHALVSAVNSSTWSVSIMDSDLCTSGTSDLRVGVAPGTGKPNIAVPLPPETGTAICAATRALVTGSPAFTGGSVLSRGIATLFTIGACLAIDGVSASPSPRNAFLIAQYDGYVTRLVHGGWLTTTNGAYLTALAGAL